MRRFVLAMVVVSTVVACGQSTSELGPDLEAGRDTYRSSCAACHGGNGEGGAGPALSEVIETFSSCDDQIRWITLGSERFKAEVGPTYGDAGKDITGVMPEFSTSLSETEIARVATYERHEFGGATAEEARGACGPTSPLSK